MKQGHEGKSSTAGRSGSVFAIVTLLNVLLVIGLLVHSSSQDRWGFMVPGVTGSEGEEEGRSGDGVLGPTVKLPNIVVKLQTANADLYVDAAFELEVATEQDKAAVHQRLSRLREVEIGILSGLTPADIRGSREIERTKERLLEKFRVVLPDQDLRALYVNNLIVD